MSGSVWYKQLTEALLPVLQSIDVTLARGTKGKLKAIVRSPEKLTVKEPLATIYFKAPRIDRIRYNWQSVMVSKDTAKAKAVMEKPAIPYILPIQIDFWTSNYTNLDEITMQWSSLFDIKRYIDVKDTEGNIRHITYTHDVPIRTEEAEDTERIFRIGYNYNFWVEVDTGEQYTTNIAKQIKISTESMDKTI